VIPVAVSSRPHRCVRLVLARFFVLPVLSERASERAIVEDEEHERGEMRKRERKSQRERERERERERKGDDERAERRESLARSLPMSELRDKESALSPPIDDQGRIPSAGFGSRIRS